jgi:Phage tail lysozyme
MAAVTQTTVPPDSSGTFSPSELATAVQIFAFLVSKGLSPQAAAGIIGNMTAESGINPESGGIDSNGLLSQGLVSWNAGGYSSAPEWSKLRTGNPAADLTTQLNFLWSNIQANQMLLASLKSAKTPADAAWYFANQFEKCAACGSVTPEVQGRQKYATAFLEYALYSGVQIPKWKPGLKVPSIPSIPNPLSGLESLAGGVGTVLGDLTSADFWERIGIFVLGLVLAGVGVALFVVATGGREVEKHPEIALAAA